eukprot:scaffold338_cov361-Pavlova_lutheri.AAC.18
MEGLMRHRMGKGHGPSMQGQSIQTAHLTDVTVVLRPAVLRVPDHRMGDATHVPADLVHTTILDLQLHQGIPSLVQGRIGTLDGSQALVAGQGWDLLCILQRTLHRLALRPTPRSFGDPGHGRVYHALFWDEAADHGQVYLGCLVLLQSCLGQLCHLWIHAEQHDPTGTAIQTIHRCNGRAECFLQDPNQRHVLTNQLRTMHHQTRRLVHRHQPSVVVQHFHRG